MVNLINIIFATVSSIIIVGIPLLLISFILKDTYFALNRIINIKNQALYSIIWDIQKILITFITILLAVNFVYCLRTIFYSSEIIYDRSHHDFIKFFYLYPIVLLFYWTALTLVNSYNIIENKKSRNVEYILDETQHKKNNFKVKLYIKIHKIFINNNFFFNILVDHTGNTCHIRIWWYCTKLNLQP